MFLYFVPSPNNTFTPEAKAALEYAIPGGNASMVECFAGPGSERGLIVTRPGVFDVDRQRYRPSEQTWRKIPNKLIWVGRWNEDRITPDSLARPEQCDGPLVTLADGQPWRVAQARKFLELDSGPLYVSSLPHDLDLNEQGKWVRSKVSAAYADLSQMAEAYWSAMIDAISTEKDQFQYDDLDRLCVASLSANYYVSDVELALLGAYSIRCRESIVSAVLDLEFARKMLEKKTDAAPDGSASSVGTEAGNAA